MNTAVQVNQEDIVIRLWDENEFAHGKEVWNDLLARSCANPLFMSWSWHHCWWQTYKKEDDRLKIWAAYADGKLVGLAPLYLEKTAYLRNMVPVRRLQFLGKRFSGSAGIRTEYISMISDRDFGKPVIRALISDLTQSKCWDELNLSDMDIRADSYPLLLAELKKQNMYGRVESEGAPYTIPSIGSFSDYLSKLGKNTRLKLFNRRKLLGTMGDVRVQPFDEESKELFFDQINHWHIQRWGGEAFNLTRKNFLFDLYQTSDGEISLEHSSMLLLDGEPLSVAINLTTGGKIYNIQLGFRESFDKRIGLGTLHLGYLIESAFESDGVEMVDFLEGEGKNSNYKSRIATEDGSFVSARWFRPFYLKALFKLYDSRFRR